MQVWMSLWIGRFDEVYVKLWTPVYLLCGAGYIYLVSRRVLSRLFSLVLVVVFLSSPLLSYHAVEVYSDLPLSIYLMLCLGSFTQMVRGAGSGGLLCGVFAAGALFVKDEAVLFVIPLMIGAAVFLARIPSLPSRERRRRAASLLLPLLAILPWCLFKLRYAPTLGVVSDFSALVFHPEDIVKAASLLLGVDNFGIVFPVLPLLALLVSGRDRGIRYAEAVIACYVLCFFALYAFVPDYHRHFNMGTIFYRNMLTAYPSACLLAALLLGELAQLSDA
jgi:4-amino-4-deoxy-L-arabinose transferase-like glycosyltransferase